MSLAIRELEQNEVISAEMVDNFVQAHDFPLVEDSSVTFIFRGKVSSVSLQHWVYGLETSIPLSPLRGTDLWYLILDLPTNARIEYKLDIVSDGKHRWVHDPFNPQRARDPYGMNSVCATAGYERPEWTLDNTEARPGSMEELVLKNTVFGLERTVQVYKPARFRNTRRYPLLVVHDGTDYLRYAAFRTVLDNLIHSLEISPMIVAFVQADDRLKEYAADNIHARFITEDVIPLMEDTYPLLKTPNHRGLLGSSFGAVASLHTAWANQGSFGRLLLQSGSFAFTDIGQHSRGPAFDPVVPFMNAFRKQPGTPAQKLYISCGTFESLIYENRSLVPLLQASGMEVKYAEARDGHNWENWRDRLREGLSWLFPGPLWMVYE